MSHSPSSSQEPKKPDTKTGSLKRTLQRGEHWIWLTGAALATCLLMIAGLLGVVLYNGADYFWPHKLALGDLPDEEKVLGVIIRSETFRTVSETDDAVYVEKDRIQFKVGNRELEADFRWIHTADLEKIRYPADAVALEREEYGDFYGYLTAILDEDEVAAEGEDAWTLFQEKHHEARAYAKDEMRILKKDIGKVNRFMQEAEVRIKRAERTLPEGPQRETEIAAARRVIEEQQTQFESLKAAAAAAGKKSRRWVAVMESANEEEVDIPLAMIVRAFRPNQMGPGSKASHYVGKVWEFLSGEPRESNTEGGILPAIFGTVFMTMIMSVAVVPFGVVAAFYLREYARQGPFVRAVRIAVNNLAGVPSIVFGVFGLGFFVYFVGGTIDHLFYPDLLPTPTYGTGGVLWASLTLALLTVPVVIVATEESIASVPRGAKEGSLALGASKFQTICRVVLPASVPGILTGLILAIARGAGEVAPLMITGVVKLAPNLPVDGHFPFVHLDRKFMHLGFHIYDVGFQSPNVEAAKPMVFTTALLLLVVVALLNIVAIYIRDRLRKKFQTGAFS